MHAAADAVNDGDKSEKKALQDVLDEKIRVVNNLKAQCIADEAKVCSLDPDNDHKENCEAAITDCESKDSFFA